MASAINERRRSPEGGGGIPPAILALILLILAGAVGTTVISGSKPTEYDAVIQPYITEITPPSPVMADEWKAPDIPTPYPEFADQQLTAWLEGFNTKSPTVIEAMIEHVPLMPPQEVQVMTETLLEHEFDQKMFEASKGVAKDMFNGQGLAAVHEMSRYFLQIPVPIANDPGFTTYMNQYFGQEVYQEALTEMAEGKRGKMAYYADTYLSYLESGEGADPELYANVKARLGLARRLHDYGMYLMEWMWLMETKLQSNPNYASTTTEQLTNNADYQAAVWYLFAVGAQVNNPLRAYWPTVNVPLNSPDDIPHVTQQAQYGIDYVDWTIKPNYPANRFIELINRLKGTPLGMRDLNKVLRTRIESPILANSHTYAGIIAGLPDQGNRRGVNSRPWDVKAQNPRL